MSKYKNNPDLELAAEKIQQAKNLLIEAESSLNCLDTMSYQVATLKLMNKSLINLATEALAQKEKIIRAKKAVNGPV